MDTKKWIPLNVKMFPRCQDIWVYTFNPLQNTPPHVCHTVTTHCEVTARYFCHYLSFDIIPMLAVAILEAKSRAAYIFTLGEAWTVRPGTLPVINDITVLTCHKISDSVAMPGQLFQRWEGECRDRWDIVPCCQHHKVANQV